MIPTVLTIRHLNSKLSFFKRFVIHFTFLFCSVCISLAQEKYDSWQPSVRDVTISYRDSTIKTQILLLSENIKTLNNLTYYWYAQNKINMNMGGYTGSLLNGEYTIYDKEKRLITQGYFDHGLKTGTWKYWNSKGILRQSIDYREGLPDGVYILFDQKGVQIEKKRYKSGVLQEESSGILRIWAAGKQKQKTDTLMTDSLKTAK